MASQPSDVPACLLVSLEFLTAEGLCVQKEQTRLLSETGVEEFSSGLGSDRMVTSVISHSRQSQSLPVFPGVDTEATSC